MAKWCLEKPVISSDCCVERCSNPHVLTCTPRFLCSVRLALESFSLIFQGISSGAQRRNCPTPWRFSRRNPYRKRHTVSSLKRTVAKSSISTLLKAGRRKRFITKRLLMRSGMNWAALGRNDISRMPSLYSFIPLFIWTASACLSECINCLQRPLLSWPCCGNASQPVDFPDWSCIL